MKARFGPKLQGRPWRSPGSSRLSRLSGPWRLLRLPRSFGSAGPDQSVDAGASAGGGDLEGSVVGDLEGPLAVVDEHGRLQTIDRRWSFEWAVGAGDRWRIAHETPGTRRHRVDDAPVYETRLRISGGDVVARVAAANDGVSRVLVVEFENLSSEAVSVALLGRANGGEVSAARDSVSLDAQPWILPERQAGGVVAACGARNPWSEIRSGPGAEPVSVRGGEVSAGLVMALPHRQSVKVQVVVEGGVPARSASPTEIASGWSSVIADALSVDVADADIGTAWRRILGDLVVQAGSYDPRSAAEAAPVLDIAGLDGEADRARATVVAAVEAGRLEGRAAVAGLRALASRDLRIGRPSGLDELADVLVASARGSLDAETARLLAWALEAKAPRAAADARGLAASIKPGVEFQPATPAAAAASSVLSPLARDSRRDRINLLVDVPHEWLGRPVDIRGFGTLWGRVSFSVRWHGRRPALLWERTGGADRVELRCAGLDSSWSSVERRGETLLAEPPSDST